jgi:hypothetical protein
MLDGPREADADRQQVGAVAAELLEEPARGGLDPAEHRLGACCDEVNITVNDVQVPEERPMLGEQEQVERQARQQEQQA